MNITFLMGNGFDIGIGMPTQYEDFYEEYCKEQKMIMIILRHSSKC